MRPIRYECTNSGRHLRRQLWGGLRVEGTGGDEVRERRLQRHAATLEHDDETQRAIQRLTREPKANLVVETPCIVLLRFA